jgi:hypothetical protein
MKLAQYGDSLTTPEQAAVLQPFKLWKGTFQMVSGYANIRA